MEQLPRPEEGFPFRLCGLLLPGTWSGTLESCPVWDTLYCLVSRGGAPNTGWRDGLCCCGDVSVSVSGRSVQLSLHQPSLTAAGGGEQYANSHRNATRPDTSHPALRLMGESRHLGALLTSWKILAAWPQNTHWPISRKAHRGEKCEACIIPKETKGHCLMPERCCPLRSLGNPHPR